jgi:hypothetical protein
LSEETLEEVMAEDEPIFKKELFSPKTKRAFLTQTTAFYARRFATY